MRYPVWICCRKRPNYDFCILHGSVAPVIRWGGLNFSHSRQVFSRCCTTKIIKIAVGQWLTCSYLRNKSGLFFETPCIVLIYRVDDGERFLDISASEQNVISVCVRVWRQLQQPVQQQRIPALSHAHRIKPLSGVRWASILHGFQPVRNACNKRNAANANAKHTCQFSAKKSKWLGHLSAKPPEKNNAYLAKLCFTREAFHCTLSAL